MKALKSFPYAGRRLKVGDHFEARGRSDARTLKAIGHAVERSLQAVSAPVTTGTYNTREMRAREPGGYTAKSLDDMEVDELRALAERRGIRVHHWAGVDKLRQALRESKDGAE